MSAALQDISLQYSASSGMRILDRSSFVNTLYLIISLSVTSVQLNEIISSIQQTEAGGHTIVLPIHIVTQKGK